MPPSPCAALPSLRIFKSLAIQAMTLFAVPYLSLVAVYGLPWTEGPA